MITETESRPELLDIARAHLQELTAILRLLDECLGAFSGRLPEPGPEFNSLAELRNGMECVRQDLLAAAIGIMNHIASLPEPGLRERFKERNK
jgi:hypothetical protein